jgi:hypothetical protein
MQALGPFDYFNPKDPKDPFLFSTFIFIKNGYLYVCITLSSRASDQRQLSTTFSCLRDGLSFHVPGKMMSKDFAPDGSEAVVLSVRVQVWG